MTLQDEQPRTRLLLPDEPDTAEAGAPRRRIGVGVAAALVALLAYSVGGPPTTTRSDAAADEPTDATRAAVAPAADGDAAGAGAGVAAGDAVPPVGFARTRDGATAAATSYVVAFGGAAMFDPARRHDVVRRLADPAVEPALQQQLDEVFGAVVTRFGLDEHGQPPPGLTFVCRVFPVGVRLLDYDDDTAEVSVWTAGVIGLAGEASTRPVAEAWSTTTVTLRWTGGDWRWVSFDQQDGPTPVSGLQPPSGPDEIADAVRNFSELPYAP